MPTPEEWEYAARAGSKTKYFFGNDPSKLKEYANFADKSFYDTKSIYSNHAHRIWDDSNAGIVSSGNYKPNPWGLYDVYGNVAEFCLDCTFRGGSYLSLYSYCNSEHFGKGSGDRFETSYIGFRVVLVPKVSRPEKKR